jgi:hypothetical protein
MRPVGLFMRLGARSTAICKPVPANNCLASAWRRVSQVAWPGRLFTHAATPHPTRSHAAEAPLIGLDALEIRLGIVHRPPPLATRHRRAALRPLGSCSGDLQHHQPHCQPHSMLPAALRLRHGHCALRGTLNFKALTYLVCATFCFNGAP